MFNLHEVGWETEAVVNKDGEVTIIDDDVVKVVLVLGAREAVI